MRRREFITLAGAAAAWPLVAHAQQQPMPVVGFLSSELSVSGAYAAEPFRQGLKETGYVEGRNVKIEYRWAEDHDDRLPELAADLVRHQVNVIATAGGALTALAAKSATTTIPIVFQIATDPVALGLVASLNRPGGNLTGMTSLNGELSLKLLEVLHELVPAATVIGFLVNPTNVNSETVSRNMNMQAVAGTLVTQLHVLNASTEDDFEGVFAEAEQMRAGGLVISPNTLFSAGSAQLAALSIRRAMPTISPFRAFAVAGGLMSYGGDIADQDRLVGTYVGRILKGEKPAELPVQQSSKIELVINLKTAKTLGIDVPLTLLGRADEVIE